MDAVPGYTNKTWFQIPPDAIPEGQDRGRLHRPVRRAVRPQPRQHVRPRDRHAHGRLQALVRRQGPGSSRPPRPTSPSSRRRSRPNSRPKASNPQDPTRTDLAATTEPTSTGLQARPRPQIIAHRAEREATRLDLVDHHDRSQEDRDHVPRHGAGLLRAGRGRGAAHAHAAGGPGQHAADAGALQPDPHHARHDHDLPGRRAGVGGLRELPAAADDRRARRRLPAAERVVVLDVPVRRHRAVRVDALLAARGRLVLLRAAVAEAVLGAPTARRRGSTWSTSPA